MTVQATNRLSYTEPGYTYGNNECELLVNVAGIKNILDVNFTLCINL